MNNYKKYIFAFIAAFIPLVTYILTLYPSVGFMDSGELAAACYTLGIPHPTGYPLYLLIGFIFSHLPIGFTPIYKLNLLSAILTSSALYVTFFSICFLIDNFIKSYNSDSSKSLEKKSHKHQKSDSKQSNFSSKIPPDGNLQILILLISSITVILIGYIRTIWSVAVQNEVYSLHFLFLSILFYYILKIIFTHPETNPKYWKLLFVFLGLSFANHMTTIFIILAVIFLLFDLYKHNKNQFYKYIKFSLFIFLGLSLYIVLIISSTFKPFLNWSDLSNVSNLPDYLSGADYSQLMFSSSANFKKNAADFFSQIFAEYSIFGLIFSIIGLALVYNYSRKLFIIFTLSVAFNLLYSFNYNIVDINIYYILTYYILGVVIPFGLIYLLSFGKIFFAVRSIKELNLLKIKVLFAGMLLIAFSIYYNYDYNNNSSNYSNADYTINAINSLEQNSVIIAYDWANLYTASLYYQLAEKLRPDVKIFNIKFLVLNWYLNSINNHYPETFNLFNQQANEFLSNYNQPDKIKNTYFTSLINSFIENVSKHYPLFVTIDVITAKEVKPFFQNYKLIPYGLLFKVQPNNADYDPTAGINVLNMNFRKFKPKSSAENKLHKLIPGMMFETAYYHFNNGNYKLSLQFVEKSLEFDPDFLDSKNLKNKILSTKNQ